MISFKKKNIYFKSLKIGKYYEPYTFNYKKKEHIHKYIKYKRVIIYYIFKKNNQINIKEISGILEKTKRRKHLTFWHIVLLKKYNNIYFSSIIKESPLLFNIKILT